MPDPEHSMKPAFLKHKNDPRGAKPKKQGNPVPKMTKVAGRRAGGALRSEQARQQKRRDAKR